MIYFKIFFLVFLKLIFEFFIGFIEFVFVFKFFFLRNLRIILSYFIILLKEREVRFNSYKRNFSNKIL